MFKTQWPLAACVHGDLCTEVTGLKEVNVHPKQTSCRSGEMSDSSLHTVHCIDVNVQVFNIKSTLVI